MSINIPTCLRGVHEKHIYTVNIHRLNVGKQNFYIVRLKRCIHNANIASQNQGEINLKIVNFKSEG